METIELRVGKGTRKDPHRWIPAIAVRRTPTRLFYRWPDDPHYCERGPVRLDCQGKTWRAVEIQEQEQAACDFSGMTDIELVLMQSQVRQAGFEEDREFLNAVLEEIGRRHKAILGRDSNEHQP